MKIINLAKKYRHLALVLIDVIVVIGSYVTSLLFLNTQITDLLEFTKEMCIAVLVYEVFLNVFQMYRDMIRYEIGEDYIKIRLFWSKNKYIVRNIHIRNIRII